jgi:V-type H+-transporting ATPase subunit H
MALSDEAAQVINLARTTKLISDTNLHTIQTLFSHRVNTDLMKTLVVGKEASLVDCLFAIMKGSHGGTTLGYVLRFTADLCQLCTSIAVEFASRPSTGTNTDPCVFFADLIDTYRDDLGVFDPAMFLLGCLLAQDKCPERPNLVKKFLAVCLSTFSASEISFSKLEYPICASAAFLRLRDNRFAFAKAGLLPHVARLLTALLTSDSPAVIQSIYELLLCARLLSFEYELLDELQRSRLLAICNRALQRSSKEKCIRMAIYILKNFSNAENSYREAQKGNIVGGHNIMVLTRMGHGNGPNFLSDMVGVGLPKTLGTLAKKKFGDTDINNEIENLLTVLENVSAHTTSWSEYRGELDSGVLDWSPCHTNVKFWKENLKKIEEGNYVALKIIGQLLLTSTNELTLAVACNDLGEMVRYHPQGHMLLTLPFMTGVKERAMTLMASSNPDVAKQALSCVKKMLVMRSFEA